jgi:hypothetical protein
MPDEEASKKAIAALDGATKDGRTIQVKEARQREERTSYRENGDGGFNNSSSYNKNRY